MKSLQHEILASVKRLADQLGRAPTRDEYREFKEFSEKCVRKEFGSWGRLVQNIKSETLESVIEKPAKFKYVAKKLDSFNIHELDLAALFKKAGNPKSLKMAGMGDTHLKYVDRRALSVFLKFLEWYNPDLFLLFGDFLDAEGLSHWPNDTLKPRRFVPEAIAGRELLKLIVRLTPRAIKRLFLEGNHEDWINQALAAKMPELFDGLEELDLMPNLEKILDFDKFGIEKIPLNHILRIGRAHYTHGLYTGDGHPSKHIKAIKGNIYYGHLHDTKSTIESGIYGLCEASSVGCLERLDAPFMKGKPTSWVHTAPIWEFFPNGDYTFMCPKIIDGKMSFNGEVFTADE